MFVQTHNEKEFKAFGDNQTQIECIDKYATGWSLSLSEMIDRLDLTGAIEFIDISFNLSVFFTLFVQMIMYMPLSNPKFYKVIKVFVNQYLQIHCD